MITDLKEKTKHTPEETFWIYTFLAILICGFFFSYYFIRKSNNRVIDLHQNFMKKSHVKFVGKNPRIPTKAQGNLINLNS